MTHDTYSMIENYMSSCMTDSAHDKEHVFRVLYNALDIARYEKNTDLDVLVCACLLHDIGRKEQFENPDLCHAAVGAKKAYDFLIENHFDVSFAEKVSHCIECHRYRSGNTPQCIEAKILFDADKLDATGNIGIARTLFYTAQVSRPLYSLDSAGLVSDGTADTTPSFFQEYKFKLEKLYDKFYTRRGNELAKQRQQAAVDFYQSLLKEVSSAYQLGREELSLLLDQKQPSS